MHAASRTNTNKHLEIKHLPPLTRHALKVIVYYYSVYIAPVCQKTLSVFVCFSDFPFICFGRFGSIWTKNKLCCQ